MKRTQILVGALGIGLAAAAAESAAIIEQDFDDTSVFTPVGGSVHNKGVTTNAGARWQSLNTAGGVVQPTMENSTSHSAAQSIHMARGATGGTTATMIGTRDPAATVSSGLVEEIIWFSREANGGFIFHGASQAENNNAGTAKVFIGDNNLSNPGGVDTATLNVYDKNKTPSPGYVATTFTALQPNTWYGVRMVVDLDSDTYDTYIDTGSGWQLAKTAGYVASGAGSLTNIHMVQVNPQSGSYFIDDIYVAPVPEPAALGLAGIVGAFALLKRRRADS